VIDWDWGASGIWLTSDRDQSFTLSPAGEWGAYDPARDRGGGWRGLLSDDLIERLKAWNDEGDAYMGRGAHEHDDEQRTAYWARGIELAEDVQRQLGDAYEVHCRAPAAFRR